jgi:CheY-like chemotaxis protein
MNTILCVDDQRDGLQIRKMLLEAIGYRVLTATEGPTALAMLDHSGIDLVILDYMMPIMDGGEVARQAKQRHPGLPIILLSGAVTEFPREVLSAVDGYIVKGQPVTALLDMIRRLLGSRPERTASPARQMKSSRELLRQSLDVVAKGKATVSDVQNHVQRIRRKRRA